MPELKTAIVGTKFRGADAVKALANATRGARITLKAEPDNEHDPNATACYLGDCHIGYIPRGQNEVLSTALRSGKTCDAEITLEGIVYKGEVKAAPKVWIIWGPVPDIGPNQNDGPADFREDT